MNSQDSAPAESKSYFQPPQNVAYYNQLTGPRFKLSYRREEKRTLKYKYDKNAPTNS